MSFLRHIGKHGDRKVAIVFREVPGEPHMCLVVYTELLNQNMHDPIIKCIESDIGQTSEHLADAFNRTHTRDGHIILQKLHAEGMLKKVQTELIIMTPAPNTKIKLNELNKILDEMKLGEDATRRLAEMDNQRGMQDPAQVARMMRGQRDAMVDVPVAPIAASGNDALGDAQLANTFRSQAERMQREANGLLAEANRLLHEAASLEPAPAKTVAKKAPAAKKAPVATKAPAATTAKGRPKKTPVVA